MPSTQNAKVTKTQQAPSGPTCTCKCSCGQCCCHGDQEQQHCVRCHADYSFNYPDACTLPHIFDDSDSEDKIDDTPVLFVSSTCCGNSISAGAPVRGDWEPVSLCDSGWHTSNPLEVEDKYNGINILRCVPGPDGKCVRKRWECFEGDKNLTVKLLAESEVEESYVKADQRDRNAFYKKMMKEKGEQYLEFTYSVKVNKVKGKNPDEDELTFEKEW